MKSRILGFVNEIEHDELQREIAIIQDFPMNGAYNEYALGNWGACMLWNRTGKASDGFSVEYEGSAIKTELGTQTLYLNSILERIFHLNHLKSARIFKASNGGIVIPHRDYLEFNKGFSRLHIPLRTNALCFNSEENDVFHMNKGEIWYLHASVPHSGGCFSEIARLHLVLDFEPTVPLTELFDDNELLSHNLFPAMIPREAMTADDFDAIYKLSTLLSPLNFMDVVSLLAKIHFQRKVSCADMFKWLIEISTSSNFPELVDRSQKMQLKYLGYS